MAGASQSVVQDSQVKIKACLVLRVMQEARVAASACRITGFANECPGNAELRVKSEGKPLTRKPPSRASLYSVISNRNRQIQNKQSGQHEAEP